MGSDELFGEGWRYHCWARRIGGNVVEWRGSGATGALASATDGSARLATRTGPLKLNARGGGAVGALQWIFESPAGQGLEDALHERILGKRGELEAPRMAVFRWFLGELRERGFERRDEWPFNFEKRGYVTLARYIDREAKFPLEDL